MPEHPKSTGKTKRNKPFPTSSGKRGQLSPHTKKIFHELDLIYAPQLVFSDSCRHLQNISIQDFAFYHEDPAKYDQLSETYGPLVSRSHVAPGVISWVSKEVGYGYFATDDILKDEMAGEYTGIITPENDHTHTDYAWKYPRVGTHEPPSSRRSVLDAVIYGNEIRFVNHSDTPCLRREWVFSDGQWHVVFIANRHIKKGEEFLVSYGQKYWRNRKKLDW